MSTTRPARILSFVAEDESTPATAIAQRLASEGWNARELLAMVQLLFAAIQIKPDLIIRYYVAGYGWFRGDQAYCIVPPSSCADSSR